MELTITYVNITNSNEEYCNSMIIEWIKSLKLLTFY